METAHLLQMVRRHGAVPLAAGQADRRARVLWARAQSATALTATKEELRGLEQRVEQMQLGSRRQSIATASDAPLSPFGAVPEDAEMCERTRRVPVARGSHRARISDGHDDHGGAPRGGAVHVAKERAFFRWQRETAIARQAAHHNEEKEVRRACTPARCARTRGAHGPARGHAGAAVRAAAGHGGEGGPFARAAGAPSTAARAAAAERGAAARMPADRWARSVDPMGAQAQHASSARATADIEERARLAADEAHQLRSAQAELVQQRDDAQRTVWPLRFAAVHARRGPSADGRHGAAPADAPARSRSARRRGCAPHAAAAGGAGLAALDAICSEAPPGPCRCQHPGRS